MMRPGFFMTLALAGAYVAGITEGWVTFFGLVVAVVLGATALDVMKWRETISSWGDSAGLDSDECNDESADESSDGSEEAK